MSSFHPNIWYPFTILENAPEPLKVVRGDGLWLELEDGRRIMDCISSWWVNIHGHARPEIAEAVARQSSELEQVIFANFTHDPAEKLAERLTGMLPGDLERVFFSDDGSTAVEVAMKIAWQYWANHGETRDTFICFEGAYHGDTFGAMSAGARTVFSEVYEPLLFDVEFLPYPQTWMGDDEVEMREREVVAALRRKLEKHPGRYAGIMIEPLVQGAGGMRMCRPEFLRALQETVRQHPTLLMFDEVMTGFGRTGSRFACEKAEVEPDLIALAKGLTGGFLPLSVTVCSERVYEAFYSSDPGKTFWHGHSYTANPIGCAAALASMDLLEEHQTVFGAMENWHREELEGLADGMPLKRLRTTGTIAAMEIETGAREGYLNPVANIVKKRCVEEGLLLRPLGNTLYLMPPYCTTREELSRMYEGIARLLEEAA